MPHLCFLVQKSRYRSVNSLAFVALSQTYFNLASRVASSPQRPTSTNAELRLRSETIDGEGKGSVVAGGAEMLRLDGSRTRQAGYRKAGKSRRAKKPRVRKRGPSCGIGVSLIGHVSRVSA